MVIFAHTTRCTKDEDRNVREEWKVELFAYDEAGSDTFTAHCTPNLIRIESNNSDDYISTVWPEGCGGDVECACIMVLAEFLSNR